MTIITIRRTQTDVLRVGLHATLRKPLVDVAGKRIEIPGEREMTFLSSRGCENLKVV
jgi:hypothetical protein